MSLSIRKSKIIIVSYLSYKMRAGQSAAAAAQGIDFIDFLV